MPGSRNGGGFARDVVLEFAEHAADGEFLGKSEFNAKVQRREVAKKNNPRFASLRLCVKVRASPGGAGEFSGVGGYKDFAPDGAADRHADLSRRNDWPRRSAAKTGMKTEAKRRRTRGKVGHGRRTRSKLAHPLEKDTFPRRFISNNCESNLAMARDFVCGIDCALRRSHTLNYHHQPAGLWH